LQPAPLRRALATRRQRVHHRRRWPPSPQGQGRYCVSDDNVTMSRPHRLRRSKADRSSTQASLNNRGISPTRAHAVRHRRRVCAVNQAVADADAGCQLVDGRAARPGDRSARPGAAQAARLHRATSRCGRTRPARDLVWAGVVAVFAGSGRRSQSCPDRMQPGAGDEHRFGVPADLRRDGAVSTAAS